MKGRQKRNKYKIKIAAVMLLMLLLWIAVFYRIIDSGNFFFSFCNNTHPIASEENGWNLILVNRNSYIPDDYEIELTELSNGEKVDSRIYPQLQEMFDDMRAEGIYPIVREGYRSAEEQEEIFAEKVQAYINEGYFRVRAERIAEEWVAVPGTSEHQLGIAVDINADKEQCENEDVYLWLAENAHEYGFILRYPQGKEEITGISYEPWHFRYVGVENAQIIYEKQICLEEFIESIK
ncbi:MAG: M15 family metallopeptidase [Lachnospiraceae bacterium]|nr:M15 family metallopeptidase [Lachnospiraceae bacterium]